MSLERLSYGWHQLLWSASWGPTLLMEVMKSAADSWRPSSTQNRNPLADGRPQPLAVCQLTSPNPCDTSCIDLVLYCCSEHHAVKSNISWKFIMLLLIFIDEVSNLVSNGKWVCLQDWFFMKLCWQWLIIPLWFNPLSMDSPPSPRPSFIILLGSNVRLISL